MPNPTTVPTGNIVGNWLLSVTLSPAIVTINYTAEQTFTVAGLNLGDFVDVAKPTLQPGLGIVNSRVSALNTLAIAFINATTATITPTANEVYAVSVTRPGNLIAAGTASALTQIT
jgi:hypothetical protein